MAKRSYKPEEIVAKLRQVDVLHSQGMTITDVMGAISRHSASVRLRCWPPTRYGS